MLPQLGIGNGFQVQIGADGIYLLNFDLYFRSEPVREWLNHPRFLCASP